MPVRTAKPNSGQLQETPHAAYSGIRLKNRFQALDDDEENEVYLRLLRKHKMSPLKTPEDRAIVRQNTQPTPIQMKDQRNRSDRQRDSCNEEDRTEHDNKNRYEQVQVEGHERSPRSDPQNGQRQNQNADQDKAKEWPLPHTPSKRKVFGSPYPSRGRGRMGRVVVRRRAPKRPLDAHSPQKEEQSQDTTQRHTGPTPAKVRELPTPPNIKGEKTKMPPPGDTNEDTDMTEGGQTQGSQQNTQDKTKKTANQTNGNGTANTTTQPALR